MKIRGFVLGVLLAVSGSARAATIPMPAEIQDIHLGMTFEEFLKIRPAIGQKLALDPESGRKDSVVVENPSTGRFKDIIYMFDDRRLVAISLYASKNNGADVLTQRKGIYQELVAGWGKASSKSIGTLEPKSKRAKHKTPVASWKKPAADIYLFTPEAAGEKDAHTILMMIGATARKKIKPGFASEPTADLEQKRLLKNSGLTDE